MQNSIVETTQRDDHSDRIFKSVPGHNVERTQATFEHGQHCRASTLQSSFFRLGDGVLGGAVGQAHAQSLNGAGHGVGGVHPAAGARPGNGAGLDLLQLRVVDFAIGVSAHRFKTDTISSLRGSPVMHPANGSAINKTDDRLSRAMAINDPGIFLSQPPMATKPSIPSQATTVSIESAMTSRETSEYFIPSEPSRCRRKL